MSSSTKMNGPGNFRLSAARRTVEAATIRVSQIHAGTARTAPAGPGRGRAPPLPKPDLGQAPCDRGGVRGVGVDADVRSGSCHLAEDLLPDGRTTCRLLDRRGIAIGDATHLVLT